MPSMIDQSLDLFRHPDFCCAGKIDVVSARFPGIVDDAVEHGPHHAGSARPSS